MTEATPPLKLDHKPTAKDEAKDFQNPDERLRAADHAHEIAILMAKRGAIGKLTGSTNDAMNTGLLILIICLILWGLSMIGVYYKAEVFNAISDDIFKVVLAVSGYIFGTNSGSKSG